MAGKLNLVSKKSDGGMVSFIDFPVARLTSHRSFSSKENVSKKTWKYVTMHVQLGGTGSARQELNKTKEQLEEEKRISLSFRIKPLDLSGLGIDSLKKKAAELWDQIVRLETEKYDLEERQKRQDYDVSLVPFPIYLYTTKLLMDEIQEKLMEIFRRMMDVELFRTLTVGLQSIFIRQCIVYRAVPCWSKVLTVDTHFSYRLIVTIRLW